MCHRARVMLSAEDRNGVKKLSGIMIPVYASVLLAMIAVAAIASGSRQELVAATATSTESR